MPQWSLSGHPHLCISYPQENIKGAPKENPEWKRFRLHRDLCHNPFKFLCLSISLYLSVSLPTLLSPPLPLITNLVQCCSRSIGCALLTLYLLGLFLFHFLFHNLYGWSIKTGPANKSKKQNKWKLFCFAENHRLSGLSLFVAKIIFHARYCHIYVFVNYSYLNYESRRVM